MKVHVGLMGCILLVGCANDPAPIEQMKLTEKTLKQVALSDANKAQAEYQLAQQHFELAVKNMAEQDYKRARVMAEQAELDARLAEAKTLRKNTDQAIDALNRQIDGLRQQLAGEQ